MNIQEYIKAVDEQFQTGLAREHSYRPALQQLLAELLPDHTTTNEPARFKCGAPDYIITQKKGAKQRCCGKRNYTRGVVTIYIIYCILQLIVSDTMNS